MSSLFQSSPILRNVETGTEYIIRQFRTVIGRNTSDKPDSKVNLHLGDSRYISHQHLELHFQPPDYFWALVKGKNGVLINGVFLPAAPTFVQLPSSCVFGFPSTPYRVEFCSMVANVVEPVKVDDADEQPKVETDRIIEPEAQALTQLNASLPLLTESVLEPLKSAAAAAVPPAEFNLKSNQESNQENAQEFDNESNQESNLELAPIRSDILYQTPKVTVLLNDAQPFLPDSNFELLTDEAICEPLERCSTPNAFQLDERKVENHQIIDLSEEESPEAAPKKVRKRPTVSKNSHQSNGAPKKKQKSLLQKITTIPTIKFQQPSSIPEHELKPSRYNDPVRRPPFSYCQLIVQAISSSRDRQRTLNEIYDWIQGTYHYFAQHKDSWKNSIRHNLSLKKQFVKVARNGFPGMGSFWRIDPNVEDDLSAKCYDIQKFMLKQFSKNVEEDDESEECILTEEIISVY